MELEIRSFDGGHESDADDAGAQGEPQAAEASKSNNVNAGLAVALCAIFGCLLRECFAVMTASFNVTGSCAAGSADLSVGFHFGGATASTVWLALGAKFFVPNCLGCFIMGILYGLKKRGKVGTRWSTLVGGLGTGFCGSLTTFSTWMAVSGEVLIGGSWLDWVNLVVLNLMLYMTFWDLGFEAVNGIAANSLRRRRARGAASRTESAPRIDNERPASPSAETAAFATGLVCTWVGVVVLTVFHEAWRVQWFSCVLAPFGALSRWGLGKFNVSPRDKDSSSSRNFQADYFPIFTAVANLIATLVRSLLGVGCLYVLNSESCSNKEMLSVVRGTVPAALWCVLKCLIAIECLLPSNINQLAHCTCTGEYLGIAVRILRQSQHSFDVCDRTEANSFA